MVVGKVFNSLIVYLELFLVYNYYSAYALKFNQRIVKRRYSVPTPSVHLLIDNRLNAPLKLLREHFEGIANFIQMEKGEIQASSRAEVIVSPRQPDQEIDGFVNFETIDNGRNVPIAMYFSIPNEYSSRLPWYGIEMQSDDPSTIMETARELPEVSPLNNEHRNFSYPERNGVITKVNQQGLALTAGMYRPAEKHRVIVKLIVHKVWTRESTLSMPSRPSIITTARTRSTASATTSTTTTPMTTTTTKSRTTTTFGDYVDPISE